MMIKREKTYHEPLSNSHKSNKGGAENKGARMKLLDPRVRGIFIVPSLIDLREL